MEEKTEEGHATVLDSGAAFAAGRLRGGDDGDIGEETAPDAELERYMDCDDKG